MADKTKTIYYALFNAHPSTRPPFTIELGIDSGNFILENCQHIPDGVSKIIEYCKDLKLSSDFVLLYPIYLDAMGGEDESTMLNIAWLIKEQADANGWQFDRIGGYTGKTERDYIPEESTKRSAGGRDENS